jgi:DNA-binding transcriptional ArsR family regulator
MDTKTFGALAEPTRFRIIELLREQPYSVTDFVKLLKIRQPQVSKHLRVLHNMGLVKVKPLAQQRIYSLNHDAFIELDQWVKSFDKVWNDRLDNLDEHFKIIKKKG